MNRHGGGPGHQGYGHCALGGTPVEQGTPVGGEAEDESLGYSEGRLGGVGHRQGGREGAGSGLPMTTAMRIGGCYLLGRPQAVTSSPTSLSWSSRWTRSAR